MCQHPCGSPVRLRNTHREPRTGNSLGEKMRAVSQRGRGGHLKETSAERCVRQEQVEAT